MSNTEQEHLLTTTPTHLVVMGVAGCGKSTVAEMVAEHFGWAFAEGDSLHPAQNVAKMSAGTPLTDEDRWPWLDLINEWTKSRSDKDISTVVTCSALKRIYRDHLRKSAANLLFIHLTATEELLLDRMKSREGHFMPPSLLPSQLATLEPLAHDEAGMTIDASCSVEEIVNIIINNLSKSPVNTKEC